MASCFRWPSALLKYGIALSGWYCREAGWVCASCSIHHFEQFRDALGTGLHRSRRCVDSALGCRFSIKGLSAEETMSLLCLLGQD